ncbi:hypothetical protein [Microbulbifer sp. JMSA002]|uniref:hypothetical protein n=1 Tax=Microbulbifer sp. JMSA002 TaxID=3243368 RepID=UPI004039F35B
MKKCITIAFFISSTASSASTSTFSEKELQHYVCHEYLKLPESAIEVRLGDGTRADCVGDDYVVEVEFARKWKDSIGQVMHYSNQTRKKPVVYLLMTSPKDMRYYHQMLETLTAQELKFPINVQPVSFYEADKAIQKKLEKYVEGHF